MRISDWISDVCSSDLSNTNINDPMNQRILNNLEAGRPGGLKVDLYLGDQPTLDLTTNNLTLLSSQQYPYTALGTIGIRKLLDPPESSLVSQIVNRHAVLQIGRAHV